MSSVRVVILIVGLLFHTKKKKQKKLPRLEVGSLDNNKEKKYPNVLKVQESQQLLLQLQQIDGG